MGGTSSPKFVLWFLAVAISSRPTVATVVWYPARVGASYLLNSILDLPVGDELSCAMKATKMDNFNLWCYENERCSLYDLDVLPFSDHSDTDTIVHCMTRIPIGGSSSLLDSSSTSTTFSTSAVTSPISSSSATTQTSTSASTTASTTTTTLTTSTTTTTLPATTTESTTTIFTTAIPDTSTTTTVTTSTTTPTTSTSTTTTALTTTSTTTPTTTTDVWMGVKNRTWTLTSRPVTNNEWNYSEPNGPLEYCGYINREMDYYLADFVCSDPSPYLCQS